MTRISGLRPPPDDRRPRSRGWSGVGATAVLAALALLAPPAPGATGASSALAASKAFSGTNGRIAFQQEGVAGDHTQTDILTMASDGSDLTRLTDTAGRNEFGPAWDASGTQLAFWRTKAPFGFGSLYVMDSDGTHKRRLTEGIDARDPAWSPNGARIVYDRNIDDLYVLRASDGLGRERVTTGKGLDFEPAWSPDGTRIAFTRGFARGDVGDIYLLVLATGRVRQVTDSAGYDHQVAWSPDGDRLVFERDFATRSAIVTVKPNGDDQRALTKGQFFDIAPAYSPDGAQIAFGTDRGVQHRQVFHDVWAMDADGQNPHPVHHLPKSESGPDWQPVVA